MAMTAAQTITAAQLETYHGVLADIFNQLPYSGISFCVASAAKVIAMQQVFKKDSDCNFREEYFIRITTAWIAAQEMVRFQNEERITMWDDVLANETIEISKYKKEGKDCPR